jgi:Papain fold toxin 1, glutamine deamidase
MKIPPYLRVNPGYPGSISSVIGNHPKNMNCVNCVVAVDRILAGGGLQSALPDLIGESILTIEDLYDRRFINVYSQTHIEILMDLAGVGARGIIYAEIAIGLGHVINVVNLDGKIVFIDGQSGKFDRISVFKNLALLRTN